MCEMARAVGVGLLSPTVSALHARWVGAEVPPRTDMSSLYHILDAACAIAVLAYVLYRRGTSLRTIGLTFRRSDIPLALLLLVLQNLMWISVGRVILRVATLPKVSAYRAGGGLMQWLAVVPGAAQEELIVRAFLMTEVAALTDNMAIAVLASVGFQALYHVYLGVPKALMMAGAFFVSAVFYAQTRRITPVILAHSLHNFLIMARWL